LQSSRAFVEVLGARLDVTTRGAGKPIVFLHSGQGLFDAEPLLHRLTALGRVIVPSHPGFGRSDLPASVTSVDDIAYVYLELLETLELSDVTLIGASFGGWIAAEMAVKCTRRLARLVLIDPLGIKLGDRETRDIVDMHSVSDDELAQLLFVDPHEHRLDYQKLDDESALIAARNRETLAFLSWRPYMHNPKLAQRLARIDVPTLVIWGAADRIALPEYGRKFSSLIPGARFELIEKAGHYPHLEQPNSVIRRLQEFMPTVPTRSPLGDQV
jgi:pimeloyl-ACP methyl ester carboxylesterase